MTTSLVAVTIVGLMLARSSSVVARWFDDDYVVPTWDDDVHDGLVGTDGREAVTGHVDWAQARY